MARPAPTRPAVASPPPTPPQLDDVVAEVALADAATFVDACARRARRPEGVGEGPGARPRPRDRPGRPPVRVQQGGARQARHARGRQALPRGARRGPGDRRHVRLLHRRGPPPVRPDRAVGDARQAAVHVPRRRSASPRSSPRATSPSPSPPGTSCRRSCAATRSCGSRPSTRRRSATRWPRSSTRAACPAACSTSSRPRARRRSPASSRRSTRAWSTRSASPARAPSARRSAS